MFNLLETKTQSLPCKLTKEELLVYGDELARLSQEITAEEERQVDIKAQMKARLTELESKRTQVVIKVSRKEEYRDVKVRLEISENANICRELREDTGEIIKTREPYPEERQRKFPCEPMIPAGA